MHDTLTKPKMPEVFRHPHANQVRSLMMDTLKLIAGSGKQGETYLSDALTSARGAPLKITSVALGSEVERRNNKLINPIRAKMTVVAHNPPYDDMDHQRRFYTAERAIDRLDEFYFRHIDEHYIQYGKPNVRALLSFREMMAKVFSLVHKLNPICLFHVRSLQNSTLAGIDDPKKREQLLQNDIVLVRIVLKDEYQSLAEYDYDFKTDLQIISPSAALSIASQRTTKKGSPE